MATTVQYYFAPQSPWTYLGHLRFWDIARKHGAAIEVLPVDLGGKVFPISGGLPLGKRAPQRQAYRLVELKRFADYLHAPLNLQPKYFPVSGDDAAKLIIAVDQQDGTHAAMHITDAVLRAVWVEERNIADEAVLAALLKERELPARRIEDAQSQAVAERYDANTQRAIEAGVFGAPSYVIDGEIFWGQDRLDFVDRRL
ncbi:MAG: 2-hydroxychromene-2-carboxylate isomerase [Aquincola sp.]|nr:2-hydroxychromene-2-carboxylate isomerase [Aquincola sp.]MDH4289904.1 2-hydroxychromene-2-carboxylate isomerase [Aquincola sp.]MDH5330781.1 2-hydroxychromene-2-carboxylate isomerase [Aquincola sp.]